MLLIKQKNKSPKSTKFMYSGISTMVLKNMYTKSWVVL